MSVAPVNPSPEPQSLWYYADDSNTAVGPLPLLELQRLARVGVIQSETHVIEKGGTEWKTFASVVPPPAHAKTKPAPADIVFSSAAIPAQEKAADGIKQRGKQGEEFFHKCGLALKGFALIAADKCKHSRKKIEEFFDNYKRGLEAQAKQRADKLPQDKRGKSPTPLGKFGQVFWILVIGVFVLVKCSDSPDSEAAKRSKTSEESATSERPVTDIENAPISKAAKISKTSEELATSERISYEKEAFTVALEVMTEELAGKLIVKAKTNLPNDTKISISLYGGTSVDSVEATDSPTVTNGAFESKPIGDHGRALPAGNYELHVSVLQKHQSPKVQSVFGEKGNNLSGPFVKNGGGHFKSVKLDRLVTVSGPESITAKRARDTELDGYRAEIRSLLDELDQFKNEPDFQRFGFAPAGRQAWLRRVEGLESRAEGLRERLGGVGGGIGGAALSLKMLGLTYSDREPRGQDVVHYRNEMTRYLGN